VALAAHWRARQPGSVLNWCYWITINDNIDPKNWQETLTSNLTGPVLLTRILLPLMQESGNASIIFTTDNKAKAYWGAYGASKSALVTTMQILADELDANQNSNKQLPVTCNAISPGPMRTNLRSAAYPGEDPNTIALPETKVPAYFYLLSDQARTTNGIHIEL